jgi:hypothetical protein
MATVTASYNWVSGETVTPAKLNTTAAPTVVVADNEVTTAKILDANVTTAKIADANVTTAKIVDANVTPAKLSQPLTLATAQNTTSGTSIDFTGIPSWVKRVTLALNAVSTNGSSIVQIQLGSGSFTTSGYAGSSSGFGIQTTTNSYTSGLALFTNNEAAAAVRIGHVLITLVSGNTWVMSANVSLSDVATTCISTSAVTISDTLDRIRLTTVNGADTFDSGSVNIMYEG